MRRIIDSATSRRIGLICLLIDKLILDTPEEKLLSHGCDLQARVVIGKWTRVWPSGILRKLIRSTHL